jgi:hypothetical protein
LRWADLTRRSEGFAGEEVGESGVVVARERHLEARKPLGEEIARAAHGRMHGTQTGSDGQRGRK